MRVTGGIRSWPGRIGGFLLPALLLLLALAGAAAGGAWVERSQLIWDSSAGKLVRQTLRAWDPQPELGLDFIWEAAGDTPAAGPISGEGRLLWLAKGAAAYDRGAIFSEYEGEVRDGRPDGRGRLRLKSGRLYEGTWRGGLMVGRGMLRYENGDRYVGAIDQGEPDGFGRYASVDGTIFEGTFRAGRRNGAGTLTMPDTRRFRSEWENGVEIVRTPLDQLPVTVAQNSGVMVSTYIDTRLNNEFVDADPDMLSYAYTATPSAGEIDIMLDAPQILGIWKGDAVLQNDEVDQTAWLFEGPEQFAPVFLVVELSNETGQTAQVTSAWFDLAESITDYQPYVIVSGSGSMMFDPALYFRNFGWSEAFEMRLVYAFGNESGPLTEDFVAEIGTLDQLLEATAIDGFLALGVDVDTLSAGNLACPRAMIDEWQCPLEAGDFAELFGGLGDAAFIVDNFLKTRMTGQLEYQWVDAEGNLNTRVSPISIDIPLAYPSAWAEGGGPAPIERGYETINLPLDQRDARIPIPFTADLAPGETRRFALNFVAEKSSRHVFQFVFELADGTIASSPTVDLLYFTPRAFALN